MIYVHDASALIAYLRNEPGAQSVVDILIEQDSVHVVHAVNLCEVYYDAIRTSSQTDAETVLTEVSSLNIVTRHDLDDALWKAAAVLKAGGGLSLADCFALALAQRLEGVLLTADHREFDPIATQGICRITFIR
jgi:PIN domain nuclease of toxin-antitoxin system